jgi:hypothetical protein
LSQGQIKEMKKFFLLLFFPILAMKIYENSKKTFQSQQLSFYHFAGHFFCVRVKSLFLLFSAHPFVSQVSLGLCENCRVKKLYDKSDEREKEARKD